MESRTVPIISEVNAMDVEKSLRSLIELYKRLGFSIIPLKYKSKEPAVKWTEFQSRKPTDGELREWFSKDNVNIGAVCGSVSGNLAVLDFDNLEVFQRFFEKSPEELTNDTLVVKTRRGYHVYLKTDKSISSFKIPELQLDVKGEGGYVVAPPSVHPTGSRYEFLGNPWKLEHILSVDDLEDWIWSRAAELGVFRFGEKEDPPCIRLLLNGVNEGMRNESAVRLASYWLQFRNLEPGEVFNRLLEWNIRNSPPMDEKELKNCLESVRKHGYEYGCLSMVELGLCSDKLKSLCNLKETFQVKRKRVRHTPSAVLSDGRLIEEAFRDGRVFFTVYDPKTDTISELEEVEDGGIIYRPVVNRDVETGQILLPSRAEEYGDEKILFQEVLNFLDYWHEQLDRFERVLDVLYVFMSWVYDALPKLPYRRALGRWGTGKSAWLETVGSVCYRPTVLAGCDSEASLRRTFDLWRGTALIDEADFNNSSLYASIVKILNIGFSRDAGWYRCCNEKDPKIIDSFYVYGPKLLATRGEFKDVALESRCLTFIARKGSGEAPLFRVDKFKAEALSLRNKLLAWRFRNFHRIAEIMQELEGRGLFKSMFNSTAEPRVAQIILPLYLMFEDEGLRASLQELVERKTEEIRALDPDAWLEDEIPRIIKQLGKEGCSKTSEEQTKIMDALEKTEVTDLQILQNYREGEVGGGFIKLKLKDIVADLLAGEDSKDIDEKTARGMAVKVSKFLRKNYGFMVKKEAKNLSYVYIPVDFLKVKTPPPKKDCKNCKSVTQEVPEKDERGNELLLTDDNFKALFEAVKSYGSDYWTASQVVDDYARAGGRDFWRLIQALSSKKWLKTNPSFWLEQHPRLKGMFRLRRR